MARFSKKQITVNCPQVFLQLGATFVTLEKNNYLRGCIGSIIAHRPLVEDILKNAQLAEGFVDKVNGVKITTVIAGKDAVLSVFDVTKKNAKKLTVPASVNKYGRIYKICTAHGKAFKNAKKLKTLIVKDKDLKKMLKKNPTKYGLKKSVKIK